MPRLVIIRAEKFERKRGSGVTAAKLSWEVVVLLRYDNALSDQYVVDVHMPAGLLVELTAEELTDLVGHGPAANCIAGGCHDGACAIITLTDGNASSVVATLLRLLRPHLNARAGAAQYWGFKASDTRPQSKAKEDEVADNITSLAHHVAEEPASKRVSTTAPKLQLNLFCDAERSAGRLMSAPPPPPPPPPSSLRFLLLCN